MNDKNDLTRSIDHFDREIKQDSSIYELKVMSPIHTAASRLDMRLLHKLRNTEEFLESVFVELTKNVIEEMLLNPFVKARVDELCEQARKQGYQDGLKAAMLS